MSYKSNMKGKRQILLCLYK